jgi:hypothetical protein
MERGDFLRQALCKKSGTNSRIIGKIVKSPIHRAI